MSSGEAGCCSYSTGVRLTFFLAFKLCFLLPCPLPGPGLSTSPCSSACESDPAGPGLFQRLTLGWDWVECTLFLFSLHKGHCVTVNILSGGRLSGISHARRVESFVLSLNKREAKKNSPRTHICLVGRRQGLLHRMEAMSFFAALPQPSWD